jgi:hypothetical protein
MNEVFATWAPKYRALGFWPRPIKPGSKGCFIRNWQLPDPEIAEDKRDSWLSNHAQGIVTERLHGENHEDF